MSVQALSLAFAVRGLSSSEKLVLLALANYANEKMICWPSQETLSDDTELSARTIWGALQGLEKRAMISREARKRGDGTRASDVITLHFAGELMANDQVANPAKATRKSCETNSQMLPNQLATVATLTTFEPSLEPTIEPGVFDLAWKAFPEPGRKRSSTKKSKPQWGPASRAAGGDGRLLACVAAFSSSDEARRDGGKFVMGFDRWLRDGFWEHWLEPVQVAAVTAIDPWPQRVREFRRNQYWNTTDWGPKPGKPGCMVPPAILSEIAA